MRRPLHFVSLTVLCAQGIFAVSDYKVKESVDPPRGWIKQGTPSPNHNINLRIALPQANFGLLEQHLYQVSDPFHERYGQHLSKEEVERLIAPHQESIDAVDRWLASHGIMEDDIQRTPANDWVKLTIPVKLVEELLNTTYFVWKHLESGDYLVRTTSYSLPIELDPYIELVQPTTMFGRFKGLRSSIVSVDDAPEVIQHSGSSFDIGNGVTVDPACNNTVTINCLMQLYNATGYKAQGKGSIGVTGYLDEIANRQDFQTFLSEQRPDAVGANFTFVSVNNGIDNQTLSAATAEAGLDIQFAFGISHPVPATFYSTGGSPEFKPDQRTPNNTNEPYTDWLEFALRDPNPPLVVSTSYGDDEETVPESFAIRVCSEAAQLGARGITLLFSSGDGGVGDGDSNPATHKCFTNDGRNVTRFLPVFPASCPFVTTVGGTAHIPEVAVSRFFSGGGFSDYFKRPAYQEKAVQEYLRTLPDGTYKGLFDPTGRAYPDVAAQSDSYRIILQGKPALISGTSAATPAFAGLVALLNDARLQMGYPPLGFLNPWLYSIGVSALNDITSGNNPGCGTDGFNATKGWDPVTGLGTPDFGKLLDLMTAADVI